MGLIILLLFSAAVIWFVMTYGGSRPARASAGQAESCCGGDIERKRAKAAADVRNEPKA